MLKGVSDVRPGYSGGHVANPSYAQVCGKKTGHAEVIQVAFDPRVLLYRDVLEVFFASHDPTTMNAQGNDIGPQYRSIILTHSDAQRETAESVIREFDAEAAFDGPIVTEIKAFEHFWPAEPEHLDYYRRNPMQPYCAYVISPKVTKVRQKFADRLK
jgi:peptide-methionine (S)-S-oxide reductase